MELRFEWDKKKNIKNQKKHGVSFETAEKVFFDLMRYEEEEYFYGYGTKNSKG